MNSKKGKAKENIIKAPSKHNVDSGAQTSWDEKEMPWEWASITSPAASRVPPIFTKDGGWVYLAPVTVSHCSRDLFQLFLLSRRLIGTNSFDNDGSSRVFAIGSEHKRDDEKPIKCFLMRSRQSSQSVSIDHWFTRWMFDDLGFFGWFATEDH
jgi:hypothetical protein